VYPKEESKTEIIDNSDSELTNIWIRQRKGDPLAQYGSYANDVWAVDENKEFLLVLQDAIDNSGEIICLASFLIGCEEIVNALMNAAQRGVRVYILSAPETILGQEKLDDEVEVDTGSRLEEYKRFLDRIAGSVLLRSARHFHSKFLLTDPHLPDRATGFLSTANFNNALWVNPELGVRLESEEITALYNQFSFAFWYESEDELLEKRAFRTTPKPPMGIKILPRFNPLPVTIASSISNNQITTLKETILRFIKVSTGPLTISTYGIDLDHDVTDVIESVVKKRDVTVIIPIREKLLSVYERLSKAGVKIIGHRRVHAKAIVSTLGGETAALVTTANLPHLGLDTGFETGLILSGDRARRVKEILTLWEEMFPYEFRSAVSLKDIKASILRSDDGFEEDIAVKDMIEVKSTPETRDSLDVEVHPSIGTDIPLCKRIRIHYKIINPLLPSKAKLVKNLDTPLPVFKKGKKLYISVSEESELGTAKDMKTDELVDAAIVIGPRHD
jgi:cardiolipin synthase